MLRKTAKLLIVGALLTCVQSKINAKSFPPNFIFGTATSAYQIEGAWNLSGKGENVWDRFTHHRPEKILDGTSGDIACDSYHKYKEDVALLKELGVDFYRFSLSWSRILPFGTSNQINPDGIRYYNDLIDELLKNDITPMVTIFHWDLPQPLQDMGGFANPLLEEWFEDYANVVFKHFGNRVKMWITFNEPIVTCLYGYGRGEKAPALDFQGVAEYLCSHHLLKAHARAYHLYERQYKDNQKGKVGITIPAHWFEPATSSKADVDSSSRMMEFTFGWHADPILHSNGNYPKVMIDRISERSEKEGYTKSRLPEFSLEDIEHLKGTFDFLGLNHYSTMLVVDKAEDPISEPSFAKDTRVIMFPDPKWPSSASPWLKVVPWGFRKLLNYVKDRYGDIDIYITENGYSDYGKLDDQERISYYEQYLSALLDAIHEDGVNVKGYAAWSLLDNFEWEDGYQHRFGLYHVDFNDSNRPRSEKASARYYKEVVTNRKLPKRKVEL